MAGTDSRFDAAKFRDAIHFAMSMGKPNATQDQLTFMWSNRQTFERQGPPSAPFDWTDTPATSHTWGPVTVPAAFELQYRQAETIATPLGNFDEPLLTVTILDTDYPLIFDDEGVRANQIALPDRGLFEILFEAPPVALFEVTVHTLYAKSLEQS